MKFNERVLELTKKIPAGRVTTYKIIAHKLGSKAYRAVGSALNKNEDPVNIPCFRVVNSGGSLGGYSLGLSKKIEKLKREGIEIKGTKIKNFEKLKYLF